MPADYDFQVDLPIYKEPASPHGGPSPEEQLSMTKSEIEKAEAVVLVVTEALELAHAADKDEVAIHVYADEEAFRLGHPTGTWIDNAEHNRIARTVARAAYRHGFDVVVHHLNAATMRAWIARQGEGETSGGDLAEADTRLTGDAALHILGLRAPDLREAPRKPAKGKTLAARIARWATDAEADEDEILELAEELLAHRLDGALGVAEAMLEPEDYAYARSAIDFIASSHTVDDGGKVLQAALFVSPIMRNGDEPLEPSVPATVQEALASVALDQMFSKLILAPFWIATSTIQRLRPTELREAAEALANGQEPPVQPASPHERDVCLLGLAMPAAEQGEEEDDEQAAVRLDAWKAIVADAAGGGHAAAPFALGRALDLLRRAKLALPDEVFGEVDEVADEGEVNEALLEALAQHLAGIGTGSALITGEEDGVFAFTIVDGAVELPPGVLREVLTEALINGGTLFVVPAATAGRKVMGHAFVLEDGEAESVSAADAATLFADEAPQDWVASPSGWQDAPALDYDPSV